MHETLMSVPNSLFYEGRINCGYQPDPQKVFLFSKRPFLFINVGNGKEKMKGTSFANFEEVETVVRMVDLCVEQFKEAAKRHKEADIIPEQRFTRNDIYVITPYNAQCNAIAERFTATNTEDQVLSIDSSQGREFDIVFVSMVRT